MSFIEITNSTSKDSKLVDRFSSILENEYDEELSKFEETKDNSFYIDWDVILRRDSSFAKAIEKEPTKYYYQMEEAIRDYDSSIDGLEKAEARLQGYDDLVQVRDIRTKSVNELISIEGIVSKSTEVKPRLSKVKFACPKCGVDHTIIQEDEELETPGQCPNCGDIKLTDEHILFNRTEMIDFQKIQIQEPPEDVEGGDNPQSIDVNIVGDMTGGVSPGDRVTATGILRGKLINSGNRGKKTIMKTYIQGLNVEKEEQDYDDLEITKADKEKFAKISNKDGIYDTLASCIAPSIFGYEKQKLALVLQLFSGVTKHVDDGNTRLRGDLHVLLVGDPGTGKSQLVRYVKQLSPRGVFTSGKGSSTAGLTAAAVRDSEFGGTDKWTLQAGALVLADKGVACVDELDKMDSSDRSALHEALEQQTVSVNKAGINSTLKSRCSLLAAANPKEGRFDEYMSVPEQINLDPPLVSRFDLIFIIRDIPDEDKDGDIADHILNTNRVGERKAAGQNDITKGTDVDEEDVDQPLDSGLFQKYVAYARKNISPELTDEAQKIIRDFYVNLRKQGKEESDAISITARKLESLVRLSEASARVRLSDEVTKEDAERAIQITKYSLSDVGVDPDTGEYDIDMLETGESKSQRDRKHTVEGIIREISENKESNEDKVAEKEAIIEKANDYGLDTGKVKKDLEKMVQNAIVAEPMTDCYYLIE